MGNSGTNTIVSTLIDSKEVISVLNENESISIYTYSYDEHLKDFGKL